MTWFVFVIVGVVVTSFPNSWQSQLGDNKMSVVFLKKSYLTLLSARTQFHVA